MTLIYDKNNLNQTLPNITSDSEYTAELDSLDVLGEPGDELSGSRTEIYRARYYAQT